MTPEIRHIEVARRLVVHATSNTVQKEFAQALADAESFGISLIEDRAARVLDERHDRLIALLNERDQEIRKVLDGVDREVATASGRKALLWLALWAVTFAFGVHGDTFALLVCSLPACIAGQYGGHWQAAKASLRMRAAEDS